MNAVKWWNDNKGQTRVRCWTIIYVKIWEDKTANINQAYQLSKLIQLTKFSWLPGKIISNVNQISCFIVDVKEKPLSFQQAVMICKEQASAIQRRSEISNKGKNIYYKW